jgi:uncharacterized membrane protein YoaK (UPF0700 family)
VVEHCAGVAVEAVGQFLVGPLADAAQPLGRVNSAYRLLAWGVMPLGAATGGVLAQLVGLRAVFLVMAVVMLATLAGMRVITDRRMAEAEHAADAGAA